MIIELPPTEYGVMPEPHYRGARSTGQPPVKDGPAPFHSRLPDRFEWTEGYKEWLGLIHVSFETGHRTWTDSAFWYRDLIASNEGALFS